MYQKHREGILYMTFAMTGALAWQVTNPLIKRYSFWFRGGMREGTGLVNKLSLPGSLSLLNVCLLSCFICFLHTTQTTIIEASLVLFNMLLACAMIEEHWVSNDQGIDYVFLSCWDV